MLYDNHDVFDLENLYWEAADNKEKEITQYKKTFLRNVNNRRRRIFK